MKTTPAMRVPLVDLAAQHAEVDEEIQAGLKDVFARTAFIGGTHVDEFEESYAQWLGSRHCIGVGNGTDALELALRACGVEPGSEVILPANTFIATAEVVSRMGGRPVLADVDPKHLLIDPQSVQQAAGPNTQALMPVHLFGQTAPVEQLEATARRFGSVIIEDAAQSQGAERFGRRAGTLGDAAGTSFYPGKNLGAAGDAGAVLTSSAVIADRVRLLSDHGSKVKYLHEVPGMNSRLDAVQAVVLSAKLARLDAWNERRRAAASYYGELLSGIAGLVLPATAEGNTDVWHIYAVRVPAAERNRVLEALTGAGIAAAIHYPVPVHLTAAYAHLGYGPGDFPVSEDAAARLISLPIYPHLERDQQEYVAATLAEALR
ncbi:MULTISPECIES: DegT/DnrJ/EryC1/StrS family aminotransferase [Arthrobacter]|uniref:DegT/DnrJ/EryC1/StrS family aminotransferase n=1 Tax=Arthrobacter TaxID=1663 RepID=UPI001D1369C9|nr:MULTISPECIES: DegT/DnrJ/EryC1/StrS family aminotransferase [Arthrobacter]MCC3282354.1 DegT/DnrJ/EryC1/StrS family aminotransferase [Arthrobacter caoxuetaonis]MCC9194147.1 DegT/DnrJ/EryC1/StrS family aminotransferase [Arthrobacter sp. zg-Y916]